MKSAVQIILTFLLLSSCTESQLTPEETVEQYQLYIAGQEYDKAKELCTESRATFIDMYPALYPNGYEVILDSTICSVNGNQATCYSYYSGLPGIPGQSSTPFFLVSEDNIWKIGPIWGHEDPFMSDSEE